VVILVLAVLTGAGLFTLTMDFGWPFLGPDVLRRVLNVDGESAYDVMTLELVVEAIVLYTAMWWAFQRYKGKPNSP
jgi:hypothetical protein